MDSKVLSHFQAISREFDAIYAGRQKSLLYRLMDILFRRAILEKRRKLILRGAGDLRAKTVLDIGCGAGRYAVYLAQLQAQSVLGIDASAAMIKLAKEAAREAAVDGTCRFEQIDFMDSSFNAKFHVLIAAGVLDYLRDSRPFLAKAYALARERAIFSFPIKWTLMTPLRSGWLLKRDCPNFYYTKRQIKRLLSECGFRIAAIHRVGSFIVPGNYVAVCSKGGGE